jgi:Peptidase M15
MKRLLTVALGAALCTLATAASARPNDVPANYGDGSHHYRSDWDSEYSHPRSHRRSAHNRHGREEAAQSGQRYAGQRSGRRHASRRSGHRHTGPRASRTPMAQRGFTNFARAGTSRGCLTSAARALLGRIESQFGHVQIISTCRPGARIAGTGRVSRHASGNAVDFNAPGGRKAEIVRWLIANHRSGGTMTYAGMSHIHVDIGPRFVSLGSGGHR